MSYSEWRGMGVRLARLASRSAWSLGDWLLYGQRRYGDRYKVALEATEFDYQTLRNYAWVARGFPAESRHERLSFQHHAEVAALSDVERELWLRRAESNRWSRNELRRQVAAHRRSQAVEPTKPEVVRLEVPPHRARRWKIAAAASGGDVAGWAVTVLDAAADQALRERPTGPGGRGRPDAVRRSRRREIRRPAERLSVGE